MLCHRRQFLQWSAAAAVFGALPLPAAALGPASSLRQASSQHDCLLSARTDAAGQHYCAAYTRDGAAVFRTPVPQRCHDVAAHPFLPRVAFNLDRLFKRATNDCAKWIAEKMNP